MELYLSVIVMGVGTSLLLHLSNILWRKPEELRRVLRSQGIGGPPPLFVLGNIREMVSIKPEGPAIATQETQSDLNCLAHDYWPTFFPFLHRWNRIYGPTFMFSAGNMVYLYVSEPEMVRDLSMNISLDFGRPNIMQSLKVCFGNGVLASNGHEWAIQRKIIAPEFYKDKVKGMIDLMVDLALLLLESWDSKLETVPDDVVEIRVDMELKKFAGDVLSRACFRGSYAQGEEVFSKVAEIERTVDVQRLVYSLPGIRLVPTARNMHLWKLDSEVKNLTNGVVEERRKKREERDLLQTMIDRENEAGLLGSFVVDNCKTMYTAGEGTTAITAQWVLLLLAYNPDWQTRVRAEIANICGGRRPNSEMLGKMTLLTQIIQETLRMYPTGPFLLRQVLRDVEVGGLRVRKGTCLWIPIIRYNYDTALWGPDADQYKPERFAGGISGACTHPHMFIPFGFGPRVCLGQYFAMAELKTLLSMLLARYKFSPSPNYRHSLSLGLAAKAKYGVQLMVARV